MADGNEPGSQNPAGGGQGQPSPSSSSGSGAGLSSQAKQLIASSLEEFLPEVKNELQEFVQDQVARQQQSLKDKRFQSHEDDIEDLKGRIAPIEDTTQRLKKYLDQGKSIDEAKEAVVQDVEDEMFKRDVQNIKQRLQSDQGEETGNPQKPWYEREAAILRQVGLEPDDPRILNLKREAGDQETYIEKLEDKAWELSMRERGSSADLAPEGEGPPPDQGEPDLQAEYQKKLQDLRQNRPGDARAVVELRKEYREKGLTGI